MRTYLEVGKTNMQLFRYDEPAALLIAEEGCVEVIDLRQWRMVRLRNRLARAFADCLNHRGPASQPLLETIRALNHPHHDLLFAVLRQNPRPSWKSETLHPVPPGQLWLELTRQCNERCIHCYAESRPELHEHMERALALRLVQEAAEMGFDTIQFTGGDPLLCPFLLDLVKEATTRGIPDREVFTNGLLLRGQLLQELVGLGTSFAISFYSHDADTHDRITRVPGSQRRTLKAIERLVAAKAPLRIGVSVMDENHQDVEATYKFLESVGVPRGQIRSCTVRPVGRGADKVGSSESGAGENPALSLRLPAGGTEQKAPKAGRGPRGKLAVAPDGVAYPCIFQRWLPLGNVHVHSLRAVYECRPGPGYLAPESAFTMCCDKIACGDCRVTAYLGSRLGFSGGAGQVPACRDPLPVVDCPRA
jgi:MoaA/NifB/PqqE/SkfB family radical SAM enzyme